MNTTPAWRDLEAIRESEAYLKVLRYHRFFYGFAAGGALVLIATYVVGVAVSSPVRPSGALVLALSAMAAVVVGVLVVCMARAVRTAQVFARPFLADGADQRERRRRKQRLNQAIFTDVFTRRRESGS
ncbi:hypothetical protein AB0I28_04510 [Phytomonospora sp. NPDC050363]|uniref:hypothetical protein n=1 Tax=Phytomonospora sp. NPDC050363 TaxID=3155642 RepID=UPI0033FABFB3